MDPEKYYVEFAEACAKGLPDKDCLKYFKRYDMKELPRIIKALGFLKSTRPREILDVGPGRGRALWPIANALPNTPITCVEKSAWRHEVISAVQRGGIYRISSLNIDISDGTPFENNSFDLVTALEVVEHIPNATAAVTEIVRVARKFILVSVPSKPDNNPDHIHFFTKEKFENLLSIAEEKTQKSLRKTTFDYIPKHMVVTISL